MSGGAPAWWDEGDVNYSLINNLLGRLHFEKVQRCPPPPPPPPPLLAGKEGEGGWEEEEEGGGGANTLRPGGGGGGQPRSRSWDGESGGGF